MDGFDFSDIPKLPGYHIEDPTTRLAGRKKTLTYKGGMCHVKDAGEQGPHREATLNTRANQDTVAKAAGLTIPGEEGGTGKYLPSFVALDKKVLQFDAYIKENMPENPEDGFRVRRFSLSFFLVDDSLQITEHKQQNSGIVQGKFLRRHKVPKDGVSMPGNSEFVTWQDMRVGAEFVVYGRPMILTSCDNFTRSFYQSKGVQMEENHAAPSDPYFVRRKREAEKSSLKVHDDRRERFITFNRKVLRFYCQWDDRNAIYGERRPYVLHFYLEDDTAEVCEVRTPNDGRDSFPKLLRRGKLPKHNTGLADIGESSTHNPKNDTKFYSDADFRIGERFSVFGREFLIYDCDDYTKQHYAKKYGMAHFPDLTDRIRTPFVEPPQRQIPPPIGFGSEEDSLGSIYSLVPKAPRRDAAKLMEYAGKALRFLGQMSDPEHPEDADRKFVITFWLADDTVSIFEPPQQNSGIVGGKFLDRQERINPATGNKYSPFEFKVGTVVEVNSFRFKIMDSDAFTQKFIATGGKNISSMLYKASLKDIMNNLAKRFEEAKAALRAAFHVMDEDRSGNITHEEFISALNMLHFDIEIADAEPLLWWFDPDWKGYISYAEFCDAILRSAKFPAFLKQFQAEKGVDQA
mmetsp:Transcript_42262/g.100348  ORF Transcript_42262/g.100348 Transcript_42262/m.100348 type:complete len:631 (+) Transcript_42262:160-2052(+)|eukprot:CAMPEP_0180134866 /NCGR_PEP_ID=MMETSP0986-20121125/10440_1 /TAXON_ID=697907 /ORGANISM="non described non described, Strain CCMP2293" /LENGTH=630 /DNA_ID=CAMNT_0022075355 /DNA_START=144 /DNA_END=2036 /DNA_ORIENTATION=+